MLLHISALRTKSFNATYPGLISYVKNKTDPLFLFSVIDKFSNSVVRFFPVKSVL